MTKNDTKPRLIRWLPLLQDFDIEIKQKKWVKNMVADHLSWIELGEKDDTLSIYDLFMWER